MNFNKAIIFGDVHGQFGNWYFFIKNNIDIYDDLVNAPIFQLGDFGIWAHSLHEQGVSLKKICENHQIYFLRGNHEEYTREGEPYFSDYDNVIVPKWFADYKHVPIFLEGYIDFNNVSTLWCGGAFSIDYKYRKEGRSWWQKEELPNLDIINSHIEKDIRPKIILTHDVPEMFANTYMTNILRPISYADGARKTGSLELNLLYNSFQPTWWLFGHYHLPFSKTDIRTGTNFVGFPIFDEGYGVFDFEKNELKLEIEK